MPTTPGATGSDRASRQARLLELLADGGRLTVLAAADDLGVSEATIRRDFADLTHRQLATRNHGGIVAGSVAYELPSRYRAGRADHDLERIATTTARLIPSGSIVGLNGGTTTTAVARAIGAASVEGPEPTTIVTNALNIASEAVLRPSVRCVALGGTARPESYETTGPITAGALAQVWLDVAVIGLAGLTAAEGAWCRHDDEAAIGKLLVDRATRVIAVAAEAKLGQRAFALLTEVARLDELVTTASGDHPEVGRLREAGVIVHCA